MPETLADTPSLTTKVVISENDVPPVRRGPRLAQLPLPLLLFLGALTVYCLTRTHLNTFDAVAYANQIGLAAQTGKLRPLFHPHHLLFNALGYGVWRLARLPGYGGGPLIVVQSLNAVLGAGGVALFYASLRRVKPTGGAALPLVMALSLMGSFGWWICATDGRVNMPSGVLMLTAFYVLLGLRERPTVRQSAAVGALAGLAVLFHESAGLFGLVGAVGIMVSVQEQRRTGRLLMTYGAAWGLTVVMAYGLVVVFALHLHSPTEFRHWINAYAERGWWWDFHILHNLRLDLFGLRHAVFVQPLGRAALAQTPLAHFGTAALGLIWLLYGSALLGLAAAGGGIAAALPRMLRSDDDRPIAVVCLAWIVLYGAFFTVWCPGAFVFWVPVLIPLGTLLALSLSRRWAVWLGIWVGVCVALNFLAGILPYLKPVAGLSQRVAVDIRAHTPPRSLIVVSGVGDDAQCEVDIPYFANRPILSLHGLLAHSPTLPATQTALNVSLARAFGAHRPVYVLDEIWSHRDSVAGLRHQSPGLTAGSLHALFSAYAMTPAWTGPRGPVWRLSPKKPAPKKPTPNPLPVREGARKAPLPLGEGLGRGLLNSYPGRSFGPARRTEGFTSKGSADDTASGTNVGGDTH